MATVEKVLSIIRTELGVKESPANSNKVKYNTWFYGRAVSGAAYPWCMAFVQWVFAQAGAKLPYLTASCSALLNWYRENRPASVVKTPLPGDIIIYNFGHTGIVESVGKGTITAIEGNTSPGTAGSQSNGGMVCRRTRNTSTVTAYIRPDYDKKEEKYGAPAGARQSGSGGESRSPGTSELPAQAGAKDMKGATTMDNNPSPAHKEGVEWAVKNGILSGNAAGDLMLSQPVTRQQLCTMLYRLSKRLSKG